MIWISLIGYAPHEGGLTCPSHSFAKSGMSGLGFASGLAKLRIGFACPPSRDGIAMVAEDFAAGPSAFAAVMSMSTR